MYKVNPKLSNLYCVRCGKKYPIDDYYSGCPECLEKGYPANLTFQYQGEMRIRPNKCGLTRYIDFLPYESFMTLGEGNTPIVEVKRFAQKYNLASVYIKNEFQNPTGSHKDRMSMITVTRAVSLKKDCVIAASSGNAGASLSAYAAAAGINCRIVSSKEINPIWKKAIETTGAQLILTETSEERGVVIQKLMEEEDCYPVTNIVNPPVGSNPFGIQGYKPISYEIYEYFGNEIPSYILIPVSRADLMWGIYEGFNDLLGLGVITKMPKLVAIEPFSRINRVLNGSDYRETFQGDYSLTTSIGGENVTYQAFEAVVKSGGFAIDICPHEVDEYQKELAEAGFYLESSSATVIGALAMASANRNIPPGSDVLMIATSSGYKDLPY